MKATFTTNGIKKTVEVKAGLAWVETTRGFDYVSMAHASILAKTGELVAIHRYPAGATA